MRLRKIEIAMLDAIFDDKPWSCSNTQVELDPATGKNVRLVILHGHCIAKLDENKDWWINLCGWNTQTTRSRLNAIIRMAAKVGYGGVDFGVSTANGKAYLRDRSGRNEIPTNGWVKVL